MPPLYAPAATTALLGRKPRTPLTSLVYHCLAPGHPQLWLLGLPGCHRRTSGVPMMWEGAAGSLIYPMRAHGAPCPAPSLPRAPSCCRPPQLAGAPPSVVVTTAAAALGSGPLRHCCLQSAPGHARWGFSAGAARPQPPPCTITFQPRSPASPGSFARPGRPRLKARGPVLRGFTAPPAAMPTFAPQAPCAPRLATPSPAPAPLARITHCGSKATAPLPRPVMCARGGG